jgi:hypothetical protein
MRVPIEEPNISRWSNHDTFDERTDHVKDEMFFGIRIVHAAPLERGGYLWPMQQAAEYPCEFEDGNGHVAAQVKNLE